VADAIALAGVRASSRSRAHAGWNLQPAANLLAPAVLLGLLRAWSWSTAPKQGLYFTAETLLIAYAYFAVVRGVHLDMMSRDPVGRYDRRRALSARCDFYHGLRRFWREIALVLLPLLGAALTLDVLTAGTGAQLRLNVHLSMLFVAVMVWARYGPAVVIASARWSPSQPPAFAEARELAASFQVASSFALVNIGFAGVALLGLAAYKSAGALLSSSRDELICLAVLFIALAWLALWLQCRWAGYIPAARGGR
jgi:hypothetical protein